MGRAEVGRTLQSHGSLLPALCGGTKHGPGLTQQDVPFRSRSCSQRAGQGYYREWGREEREGGEKEDRQGRRERKPREGRGQEGDGLKH